MEALLTLTGIADVCSSTNNANVVQQAAAAARAAAAESLGKKFTLPSLTNASEANLPTSFSDTMSPEAMAAFDASVSTTIQQQQSQSKKTSLSSKKTTSSSSSSALNSLTSSLTQSLGLSSSSSSTTSSYLQPPTNTTNMPHLSNSSLSLLLKHEDAIPTLVSLLNNEDEYVYEQAVWILGNMVDSSCTENKNGAARNVILAAGGLKPLLQCMQAHVSSLSLQRIASWTLSNLMEGIFQTSKTSSSSTSKSDYNASDEVNMKELLPVLRRCLNMADPEVLSYTCWTLSHLCDGPSSHIAAVVTSTTNKKKGGLVPRLIELLLHSSWRVTKPALRTIGNIVCAECSSSDTTTEENTDYTQVIIQCGAVPFLKKLVSHNNREIQKEACWTLSNIAAGTVDQIQAVIDSGAIAPLVKLVSNKKTDQEVRSEACWVVLNATSCGSDSQIETLVKEGCVSVLGVLLTEPSMVMMALEGLERVLQVEESREAKSKTPSTTPMLVSASLIEKAQDKHNSTAVKKRADRIWKQHFVSCALCHESFSKHRTADATFCEECKCHVCSKCDCKKYHLSYQEELWAATEEKTEAKKNAKKSKNKKKKQKQKKAKQASAGVDTVSSQPSADTTKVTVEGATGKLGSQQNESSVESGSRKSRGDESTASGDGGGVDKSASTKGSHNKKDRTAGKSGLDDEFDIDGMLDEQEQQQPPIDFVLYLQQTGSIIALAKLMDALEEGGEYNDEYLDDKELQLIRSMQQQATSQ